MIVISRKIAAEAAMISFIMLSLTKFAKALSDVLAAFVPDVESVELVGTVEF